MVGFPPKSANTLDQDPKVSSSPDSLVSYNPKLEDFSFLDSFLDFDSFNCLGTDRNLGDFSLEENQFGFLEDGMEMTQDNLTSLGSDSIKLNSECFHDTSEASPSHVPEQGLMVVAQNPVSSCGSVLLESVPVVNVELKKSEGLTCSIAVEMEKVSLAVDGDGTKNESDSSESKSQVSCSSSSTSDSGSSCSSSDEEVEKKKEELDARKEDGNAGELEEGEIEGEDDEELDEDEYENGGGVGGGDDAMIAWSDDEDEDHIATQSKEPLRSKNELKVTLSPLVAFPPFCIYIISHACLARFFSI